MSAGSVAEDGENYVVSCKRVRDCARFGSRELGGARSDVYKRLWCVP